MTNALLIKKLQSLGACNEALEWLGERDSRQMYDDCKRGEWLIWLAEKLGAEEKKLHLIGCKIAYSTLENFEKLYPEDKRPREAIDAKEKWLRGEISDVELDAASSAAWSAESAAWSAESAAWSAAWSAESAAWSAESAAWSEQADIFRQIISFEEIENSLTK